MIGDDSVLGCSMCYIIYRVHTCRFVECSCNNVACASVLSKWGNVVEAPPLYFCQPGLERGAERVCPPQAQAIFTLESNHLVWPWKTRPPASRRININTHAKEIHVGKAIFPTAPRRTDFSHRRPRTFLVLRIQWRILWFSMACLPISRV